MGSAVLAVSTIYGWTLPAAPKAYGWWAVAFVTETVSKGLLLLGPEFVELSDLLHAAAAAMILGGAVVWSGRAFGPVGMTLGVTVAVVWTIIAQIPRQSFDLLPLPLFGIGGAALMIAGGTIALRRATAIRDGDKVAAASFLAAGLHQVLAPWMLAHPALATWDMLLSQFLSMVLSVALLAVVLHKQQARAEREGERADVLQRRLGDALGSVQDGIALYDKDDRLVTCNRRYSEFLAPLAHVVQPGRTFQEIIDASLQHGWVPEAAVDVKQWRELALAQHADAPETAREQQYADGRWVSVNVYRTTDHGHLRILRDITNRKQAESALQEGVAWLKGIMDAVVDGIITIDDAGTVLSFNPAAERIFGWPINEVIGRNVSMLMPEPFRSEHDGYITRFLETGERRIIGLGRQVIGRRRDGTTFPVELSVTQMYQKDLTTFIGVVRDITDRKRVEDALVEGERRFRAQAFQLQAIIDNMAQGVAVFDGAEQLMALNDVSRQMLDLPEDATKAGSTDFAAFMALLATAGEDDTAVERRLASVRLHPALVFEHARPSGLVLEIRSTAMPGGGLILTFTDITERKKYEDALREAKEAAERGNRSKATFLANISHELRTPLNAIIGFSELMKHEIFGPLEPVNYRHYVDDIHESGMHLLELINDILDMSKAEAGMTDLVESPVDVAGIIRSSVRMMTKRAESAHIVLTEDVPDSLPLLRADERRIRQIVLNLLSNAVKFTDEFGRVTIMAHCRPEGFSITISDTGIGMTPEDLLRVMEPFVQADTRLSRKYEGTGLGLPLTKALVNAHGGILTLDSEPAVGTTATATFPAHRVIAMELLGDPAV